MKKRIVVTGLGVVSCFGNDVDTFYKQLLAGKSGAAPITHFLVPIFLRGSLASITDFDPGTYIEKKQARRIDKYIAYGYCRRKKALWKQAGLNLRNP